jgi:hypothetical protein
MLQYLEGYQGQIIYEERIYNDINELKQAIKKGKTTLILKPKGVKQEEQKTPTPTPTVDSQKYRIVVKQYMTKPASPTFDFMQKWNNNIPMPCATMIVQKIKETAGMVYVKGVNETRDKEWCGWIIKSAILYEEKI